MSKERVDSGYFGAKSTWKAKDDDSTMMVRKAPTVPRMGEAARDRSRRPLTAVDKMKQRENMEANLTWNVGGSAAVSHKHNNYAEKAKESEMKLGYRVRVSESAMKGYVTKKTEKGDNVHDAAEEDAEPGGEVVAEETGGEEEEAGDAMDVAAEGGGVDEGGEEEGAGDAMGVAAQGGGVDEGGEEEEAGDAMDVVRGRSA